MLTSNIFKRFITVVTTVLLCVSSMSSGLGEVSAAAPALQLQDEAALSHGVTYHTFSKEMNDHAVRIHVVKVQLDHPYVRVAPMFGDQVGGKERVTTMADKEEAVAGINASFFNMQNEGGTFGSIVKDGDIISNPADVKDWNTFAVLSNKTAIIQELGFTGQVTAPHGDTYPLTGINQTQYWPPGSQASNYSGTIHMFTREWADNSRGHLDGYSELIEVEVTEDIVTDIRLNDEPKRIPENGYVLMAHGKGHRFLEEHFEVGDPIQISYSLTPENLEIEQAIGANYLLVDQGQQVAQMPTDSALKGRNSRSALGVTKDGKTLYIVSIDRSDSNPGITLAELAAILIDLGSDKAVNLDGGGSTSLAVRNLGDFSTTRVNDSIWERSVADALGIFNIAPKDTLLKMEVNGPGLVLLNEERTYSFMGYDKNYHPIKASEANWRTEYDAGVSEHNRITWTTAGQSKVTAEKDGISASIPVFVVGPEHIASFDLSAKDIYLFPQDEQELSAMLALTTEETLTLKADQIEWEITPNLGQLNQLTFHAGNEEGTGVIRASVLGVTQEIPVVVGYTFRDIQGHWAKETIEYMAKEGHARGIRSGDFAPNHDLTRADLLVFLSRVLDWNMTEREHAVKLNESVPAYAESAVKYAVHHGMIKGDEKGRIEASRPISRMEMATILERILSAPGNETEEQQGIPMDQVYADWNSVPAWASGSVQYVTDRQIFGGRNGKFMPRNHITRAEVITVLYRSFFR